MLRLLVLASVAHAGKQDRSFAQISIDGPVDTPPPKGSALDQEIQALDELIKAQQKKLAALGALRKAGTAPPDDARGHVCRASRGVEGARVRLERKTTAGSAEGRG